jgi:hypothetical protein
VRPGGIPLYDFRLQSDFIFRLLNFSMEMENADKDKMKLT